MYRMQCSGKLVAFNQLFICLPHGPADVVDRFYRIGLHEQNSEDQNPVQERKQCVWYGGKEEEME